MAPTSRGLARRIAHLATAQPAHTIAEFGPGTGAITGELLSALPADGRLWAFEVHPPFVAHLRATIDDPRLTVVAESAQAIARLHEYQERPRFDAIVSAVPFSLMDPTHTTEILRAAAQALRPDGIFVALQYHPRYLAPLLRAEFAVVEREVYPWNIPPAMLLRAGNPLGVDGATPAGAR
ncbi:MAG: methyltransferase domain-containing protein [Chloroflexota bacterium]|nr:methyltransferase domain-containing protein [Chloroflexota bacterium]